MSNINFIIKDDDTVIVSNGNTNVELSSQDVKDYHHDWEYANTALTFKEYLYEEGRENM